MTHLGLHWQGEQEDAKRLNFGKTKKEGRIRTRLLWQVRFIFSVCFSQHGLDSMLQLGHKIEHGFDRILHQEKNKYY